MLIKNIINYYKNLPHQNKALEILQNIFDLADPKLKEQFINTWRKGGNISENYMKLYPLAENNKIVKDRDGLIVFKLDLISNDSKSKTILVNSGARNSQIILPPEQDYSGSLRPIPHGEYRIGWPEKCPYGSWGEGIGEWWVPLYPISPKHNRTALGIHLDSNREYSPGSAGCIITKTIGDMVSIVEFINNYKPNKLIVDYGFNNKTINNSNTDLESFLYNKLPFVIGYVEGNRDIYGKPTKNYYGHKDPGNNKINLGSFSYQHHNNSMSPEEADSKWLSILVPEVIKASNKLNIVNYEKHDRYKFILYNIADLYTQAPAACMGNRGFVDLLLDKKTALLSLSEKDIVDLRVKSYIDPNTNKLDAPGFNNDINKLKKDQERRVSAILEFMDRTK